MCTFMVYLYVYDYMYVYVCLCIILYLYGYARGSHNNHPISQTLRRYSNFKFDEVLQVVSDVLKALKEQASTIIYDNLSKLKNPNFG